MIDLTDIELFKDLVFINQGDITFDIHNDFDCTGLSYDKNIASLNLFFNPSESKKSELRKRFKIEFSDVVLVKFEFILNRTIDSATINNIYRGRFEQDSKLLEYSADGSRYFYIEFEAGDKIELFSKKVQLFET